MSFIITFTVAHKFPLKLTCSLCSECFQSMVWNCPLYTTYVCTLPCWQLRDITLFLSLFCVSYH